jgi:4-hydroxybenzoate polyprenyltransferase
MHFDVHFTLARLKAYASLMRLNRPIGILLLLWPTLWALYIAGNGHPSIKLVAIFVAGVVLMRSAGCVINDFWDRSFDGRVARTRHRPLTSGKISATEAWLLFLLLCLFSAALLLLLPLLARLLAIAALFITVLYPLLKRYTYLPQFVLGVAFSWGILMVFAAQLGRLPPVAWLVFFIACLWPIAYDTIYAMVDRPDDLKIGIKSTAILWDEKDTLIIAILHGVMLTLLVFLGFFLSLNAYYYLGLIAAAGVMGYQQHLIRDRQPEKCFKAFLVSHWAGCAVFIGLVMAF